jgi:superfamily II DNA/RNA helicase
MNEISKAVDDLGWLLPTDIQSDAIPLILGNNL